MRTRREILNDLFFLNEFPHTISNELHHYSFDVEFPVFFITKKDMVFVLEKIKNTNFEPQTIEDWANLIECREDVAFEDDILQEIIHKLANPLLNNFYYSQKEFQFLIDCLV